MRPDAKRRAELRPHGIANVPCRACEFLRLCGGVQTSRPLLDCFDENCCHRGLGLHDQFCPNRFAIFCRFFVTSAAHWKPMIASRSIRRRLPYLIPPAHRSPLSSPAALESPFVAIDTYKIFKLKKGRYRAIAESPEGPARRRSGLVHQRESCFAALPRTRRKVLGLSQYGSARRSVGQLGISLAVGPNFSVFLGVPRTDNLYNLKRQRTCLADMAASSISVVRTSARSRRATGNIGPAF